MSELKHIAFVTPHTDITSEMDLHRFLPDHVAHTQRMWLDEVGEAAERRMVAEALPLALGYLAGIVPFQCGVFGCTSASAVNGRQGMLEIERRMEEALGCPCITVLGAVLREIDRRGARSVALLTPYTREVTAFMKATLEMFGVPVAYITGMGLSEDRDIAALRPAEILAYTGEKKASIPATADLCFFSCTNVRSAEIREELEALLEKPVITSNHCVIEYIRSL